MDFLRVCGSWIFIASVAAAQVSTAPSAVVASMPSVSAQIQPALSTLRQSLNGVSVDRWKLPKDVRDSTNANVGSIRRDLDATLPGLLSAADAAPNSVASMLPVAQNMSALYEVALRVSIVADAAAPQDQAAALAAALNGLDSARRSFNERVQTAAQAQEKQAAALQKQVTTLSAPATVPPPPVCPPPAPARKKKAAVTPPPA